MKKYVWMMVVLVALAFVAFVAEAQSVKLLTINESARWNGATHVVEIGPADLTTTTTNTAQTLTVAVLAKQGVELVASVLAEPFQDVATNGNNTLTVIVGDGTDDDLYLASQELCVDGTEVFLKYGRSAWNSGAATNVTFAYSAKVYTADDTIDIKITPHSNYAVSAMDNGLLRLYFRILDAVGRLR